MKDDIKAKLSSMLSGIDKEAVKKFLENGGTQKLEKAFSEEEKQRMTEKFMKMDSDELAKKLQSVDLKNLDLDSILKKIK